MMLVHSMMLIMHPSNKLQHTKVIDEGIVIFFSDDIYIHLFLL